MIDNVSAAEELLACSAFAQDERGLVAVDPAVLQKAAELLAQSATTDLTALQRERDALGWAVMRMGVALRLIRVFGMGGVALPGSGMIRDWLCGWIDADLFDALHWPSAIPMACDLLTQWGYQEVGGFIGRTLPTDGKAGATVQ